MGHLVGWIEWMGWMYNLWLFGVILGGHLIGSVGLLVFLCGLLLALWAFWWMAGRGGPFFVFRRAFLWAIWWDDMDWMDECFYVVF